MRAPGLPSLGWAGRPPPAVVQLSWVGCCAGSSKWSALRQYVNTFKSSSSWDVLIQRHYTSKRALWFPFSLKCCKEAVLHNRVGVTVFLCFFYQLEANRFGHADRVEKYLQVTCLELCPHGRLLQCLQTGCWPGFLQPWAAEAVSHLAPPCTAPRGMSSTAVT